MVLKKGLLRQTFVPWASLLFPPPHPNPLPLLYYLPSPPLGEKVQDEGAYLPPLTLALSPWGRGESTGKEFPEERRKHVKRVHRSGEEKTGKGLPFRLYPFSPCGGEGGDEGAYRA